MTRAELEYVEPDLDVVYGNRPYWRLGAPPDLMMRLKRIFPRAETYRREWITLDHTAEVARDLEWVMGRWEFAVAAEDLEVLREAAEDHREREERVMEILTGKRDTLEFREPARQPREYQSIAAELARASRGLLLADDLGLGKSMSGLLLLLDPELLPALIVCPTHLPRQWQSELQKTLPWLTAHIIRSGQPYDPKTRREMKGRDPDVLIVNYHKIRGWADHLPGRIRTVIFDEAQELRRSDSEKYKAAARIADGADARMGLTATPVFNYAGEIHNIISVLAPEVLGSREEFAREWGAGQYWHDKLKVGDPKALGVYLREQGVMLRRTRKDVDRELPAGKPLRIEHSVAADQDVHDSMMSGAYDLAQAILSGDRKEAFAASGELDWQERQATGIAKAPYVAEFVKMILESERKVVLFGWHREVYRMWLRALADYNPVMYTGSESPAQKQASVERFLETPDDEKDECRVFIMSLRSGAGLDGLQEVANVVVFGEIDWSPAMHDQCIGRLFRDGQEQAVVAYFLVSDVGSDPVISEVLNIKRMQSEPLRDPDAELFEAAEDNSGRVRRLAEKVIQRRQGVTVPF